MLDGKTVVVTGGAGLLGRELCKSIAREGGTAAIADIDLSKADAFARNVNETFPGAKSFGVRIDITDSESIRTAITQIASRTGKIDALVNSAYPRNRNYGKKLEDVGYESFCENVNMHLGGYFLASKEFAAYFRTAGSGHIINMSSIYGVVAPRFEIYENTPMTMPVEYAAIKSGIIHLMRYMAKYFKGTGVRFNCISPGGIKDAQPESFLSNYAEYSLTKGMLDPIDLCGTLVFLLSDGSKFINGQNIIVDDGWSL